MHDEQSGWAGVGWAAWTDPGQIRARLEAGADPDVVLRGQQRPLDMAAKHGSAEVVAEMASRVGDVDAMTLGTYRVVACGVCQPSRQRPRVAGRGR